MKAVCRIKLMPFPASALIFMMCAPAISVVPSSATVSGMQRFARLMQHWVTKTIFSQSTAALTHRAGAFMRLAAF